MVRLVSFYWQVLKMRFSYALLLHFNADAESSRHETSALVQFFSKEVFLRQGSLAEFTLYKIVFMQCYKLKKPPVQICNSFSEENFLMQRYLYSAPSEVWRPRSARCTKRADQRCIYTFTVKRSKCNR